MRPSHGWHVVAVIVVLLTATGATAAPRRVVSASLCTDEYVFRLLPRARIAALSFLAADRHPVVSTIVDAVEGIALVHASAEEILARHPDAVVLYAGTEPRLHVQLKAAGVAVIDVPWANSLAQVRSATLGLGRALDAQARARSLLARMDRVLADAHPQTPPLRALIYEPNGYATADGVTDEVLAAAGLADAAGTIGATRAGTVPVEAVVASPPALLILNGGNAAHPALADLVLQHPALKALSARSVVAHMSLTPLLCPGPWSVETVPVLAAWARKARALARPGSPP